MSPGQILLDVPIRSRSGEPNRLAQSLDTAAFLSLCSVVVFGPLAFGAVEGWSTFIMQAVLGLVALLLIVNALVSPGSSGGLRHPAVVPVALFTTLVFVQLGLGLSLYAHATLVEGLKVVAYGIGFCAALQTLRSNDRLRRFCLFLSIFGFAISLLAIAQNFSSPDKLYWFRVPSQPGNIFGPYVNRNHYAGLMEMLVPFAVMGFLVPYTRKEKRLLALFAAALGSASLVLSLSRGGAIAFVAEMIFLAAFLALGTQNRNAAIGVASLGLPLIGLVAWLGRAAVIERFGNMQDWMRLAIYRDGLSMIVDHPIAGIGLGTFPTVYPQFRSFPTDYFVNQAHNDLLQLTIEMGLAGLVLVLWFLYLVYRAGMGKAQGWVHSWKGAAALASLTGVTGILVHCLSDFNLRIPANALLFCILCGVAASREREKALLIEKSPRFRRSAGDDFQ
jgi:O-antigen ligase